MRQTDKALATIYRKVLRQDFPTFLARVFQTINPGTPFQGNWHQELIMEYLSACESGELQRLIINMPPRMLKSTTVSVAWPAWILGKNPNERILVASFAKSLALRHSLDTRMVMQAPWYRQAFPEASLSRDQNERFKFLTTERGFRMAASVGSAITGEGGNFLIVDDPLSPPQAARAQARSHCIDWFNHTFLTRLDDKQKGVIVVVMQRLHPEDLSGYLLKQKTGWEHLVLPAISERETRYSFGGLSFLREAQEPLHPEREPLSLLNRVRAEIGALAFAAQYQQQPVLADGMLVRPAWIKRYETPPDTEVQVVLSWDTAIQAGENRDYSVCSVWYYNGRAHFLIDVLRQRLEYPELKHTVISLADKWRPHAVLIENKASGQSLIQDIRRETSLPVIPVTPKQDKVSRLAAVTPLFEAGNVLFPVRASWLAVLEEELFAFPQGPHDDQVDSLSQYLNWMREKRPVSYRVRSL